MTETDFCIRNISRDARKLVAKKFYEMHMGISPFPNLSHYTNANINKDAQALCLYAAILWTGVYKNNNIECDGEARKQDENARRLLRERNRYRNLNDEQFDFAIDNIISTEIRNCFAHGNFGISSLESGEDFFVLSPNPSRTIFESQQNIYVSFENAYNAVVDFIEEQSQNAAPEKRFQNIDVPTMLLNLFFCVNGYEINDLGKIDGERFKSLIKALEISLLCADFTWNQNTFYEDYGKESEIFKMITLLRNSVVHGTMQISSDAKTIYIDNAKSTDLRSHSENASNFLMKILVADMEKDITGIGKEADSPAMIEESKKIVQDGFLEESGSLSEILLKAFENFMPDQDEQGQETRNN